MKKKKDASEFAAGMPGAEVNNENEPMDSRAAAALLTEPGDEPRITEKEVKKAAEILQKYKEGKANLESRVVDEELWWEGRHWESIGKKDSGGTVSPKPVSAWLFNAVANKHADAMDNYPEPVVLPRERSDDESAKTLSSVLPVVLERNKYEQTYSNDWWEKLKHGTAPYAVLWDPSAENGLGDICIKDVDILKLFWEPGVTDIQKSRNLFWVELVDEDIMDKAYPQYAGQLSGDAVELKKYLYNDDVDLSEKIMVVDWYYKVSAPDGREVLQYCKFAGGKVLFASENDPQYKDVGWYAHGMYPVVFDVLYPQKGTPTGFGYISICRDPQMYIDQLYADILESLERNMRQRYLMGTNTGINKEQFEDWQTYDIVDCESKLDDSHIREIPKSQLDHTYLDILQLKIEEMKDTASNRDISSGGSAPGVTAAAAIAALQEAGNKVSRDMISSSYRAFTQIATLCIELMRQFYDEARSFRITGDQPGDYSFVEMSNAGIKEQEVGLTTDGIPMYRKPIFDLKIKAQKRNPFSRMEQNERSKELYGLGFFDPNRAQEAQGALEMMDFEGKDKVVEYVRQGQTLLNMCQQMSQQMDQMAAIIQATTGMNMGVAAPMQGAPAPTEPQKAPGGGQTVNDTIMEAQTPKTPYAQRIVAATNTDMSKASNAAMPK